MADEQKEIWAAAALHGADVYYLLPYLATPAILFGH